MGIEKASQLDPAFLVAFKKMHTEKKHSSVDDFKHLTLEQQLDKLQDRTFPEQNAFVLDDGRFLAALCTRRAGKSNGLALRYLRTMMKHPGCFCPYIALTRDSARNIMWDILQEKDELYKIGAKFLESKLTMELPNGSRLQLFGADMQNFIRRLRGIKTPGGSVDEVQNFGAHVSELVDDILTPSIVDYKDGWIALTGTPGPVPHGLFYEITERRALGYKVHTWSVFQNPYIPNARSFVEELALKRGWTKDNPTYLREWCGKWALDLDALVFKYTEANHYDTLPTLEAKWEYVIGVDVGFNDADAIVVLGWNPKIKEVYLVEEKVQAKQGITDLADQIEGLIEKYGPIRVVMDTGGLGKKIAEEMRTRYGLPIQAAEKTRKFEFIELLNDAMRTRKFYAKRDSRFADDASRVKWDRDSSVLKISDLFHSDVCDSTLYAYRECLHWLYEKEPESPKVNTPEWFKAETDKIEQELENRLIEEQGEDRFWREGVSD